MNDQIVERPPYTVKEVAKLLNVSTRAIYDECHRNHIRHVKINTTIRIPVDAFEEYRNKITVPIGA